MKVSLKRLVGPVKRASWLLHARPLCIQPASYRSGVTGVHALGKPLPTQTAHLPTGHQGVTQQIPHLAIASPFGPDIGWQRNRAGSLALPVNAEDVPIRAILLPIGVWRMPIRPPELPSSMKEPEELSLKVASLRASTSTFIAWRQGQELSLEERGGHIFVQVAGSQDDRSG